MKRILFTGVGRTDPCKNCHDGAILHILRWYDDITDVYLYFTKEMTEEQEKTNIYQLAFDHFKSRTNKQFETHDILTNIVEAEDFNIFYDDMFTKCKEIIEENPDVELIINVSSGTPAMKANLLLVATELDYHHVKCVQVVHPSRSSDSGVNTKNPEYDIFKELLENKDEINSKSINRCKEIESVSFKKLRDKSKIESLIRSYNYSMIKKDFQNYHFNKETRCFLEYLLSKSQMKDFLECKIENLKTKYPSFNFEKFNDYIEYYLIIKNIQKSGKITEFILRLNPLVVSLLKQFLKVVNNVDIEETSVMDNKIIYIDPRKFEETYSDCYNYLICNDIELKKKPLSMFILYKIVRYYNDDSNDIKVKKAVEFFKKAKEINEQRNCVAHELLSVDDKELFDKFSVNSNWIIEQLDSIFTFLYKNEFTRANKYYDEANKLIISEL